MDVASQSFPWREFIVFLLQALGILSGCAVAALVIIFGYLALGHVITSFATRFSKRTAKIIRAITFLITAFGPPVVVYTWTTLSGVPAIFALPLAGMIFGGTLALSGVFLASTREVPDKKLSESHKEYRVYMPDEPIEPTPQPTEG